MDKKQCEGCILVYTEGELMTLRCVRKSKHDGKCATEWLGHYMQWPI